MQCVICRAIKVMVLCEEAIAIRVSSPSTTHMKAYMAVMAGVPSRTQPPPSNGEEELHLPAGNLHPPGEMPQCLQADLGNLADGKLHQLMDDLHQLFQPAAPAQPDGGWVPPGQPPQPPNICST